MNAAQHNEARLQMTNQQVRTWDVLDADVLAVQASVPREQFVPRGLEAVAYADAPLPLGDGQHLWAPKLDGKVLQALNIKPHERVLEIGAGSGYLSACLVGLGAKVTAVEINPRLARSAQDNWARCHISGIELITGDALALSLPPQFDVVLFGAAVRTIPAIAWGVIKSTGRILAPLGGELQSMSRVQGSADHPLVEPLFETSVDPLIQAPRKQFEF